MNMIKVYTFISDACMFLIGAVLFGFIIGKGIIWFLDRNRKSKNNPNNSFFV